MKSILTLLFFIHFFLSISLAQNFGTARGLMGSQSECVNQKLELITLNAVKQMVSDNDTRFDLSGMVDFQGKILVIADKEWDKFIYEVEVGSDNFKCGTFIDLCPDFKMDIEGIDYSNKHFYLIEETTNDVYEVFIGLCKMSKLPIPFDKFGIDRSEWGNKGFEGIAVDGVNQILYLAKEREPRRIFSVDLKTLDISEPFVDQLFDGGGHDISDMKYENGFLYIMERGLGQITRINIETKEKVSVSYQDYVYSNGYRMYMNQNPQYGMDEAFMLRNNEIWIGIDNNGDPVSEYGKSVGLKDGNKTAIIVFKRPKGF